MRTRRTLVGAALAAAALGATALTAAPAQAAPITQIPMLGVGVSGLVVPGPVVVFVHATPIGGGKVLFSAPLGPAECATTAGRALIDIGFVNPTGRSQTVTVKPCDFNYHPGVNRVVEATTGAGQVFVTATVRGYPSLPGAGTFTAR